MHSMNAYVVAAAMLALSGLASPAGAQGQFVPQAAAGQPPVIQAPADATPQFSKGEPAPQFTTGALPQLSAPEQEPLPSNPVGSGWATQVDSTALPTAGYEGRALEVIRMVNAYFNGIINLQGRFVQIDPSQKETKGKFYVQRPGLLRFDYAPPSKMRIVADGRYLSIENHDLRTIDKYPLESTPFRMLLRPDVDLLRDANIVNFVEQDGLVTVTIEDRTGESAGRLTLSFALTEEEPGLEIREWIITDPQGLDTRIKLADLVTGKQVANDFFASATIGVDVGFPRHD